MVSAGCLLTSKTSGAYSLAGCTVVPGFDFADFSLLSDYPDGCASLRHRFPEFERFLLPAHA